MQTQFRRESLSAQRTAKVYWLRPKGRFVEFVANKTDHGFHELARIKFSTASEAFTAAVN